MLHRPRSRIDSATLEHIAGEVTIHTSPAPTVMTHIVIHDALLPDTIGKPTHTTIMARVTVKDLRAEARRRLLKCGNGKTISRMNKRELLEFLSCIHHPDADNLGGDDLGASVAGMFREPKAPRPKKRKGKMPKAYVPVSEEPDDLSDVSFTGRGIPDTYKAFVKAMLPHVRAKGLGPQAAMKTVAMMWRKHKGQKLG